MSASEKVSLDTVQSDVNHLFQLLDTINDTLMEMPFVREGTRDTQLDRVASLIWIARDRAEHLVSDIDGSYSKLAGLREVSS